MLFSSARPQFSPAALKCVFSHIMSYHFKNHQVYLFTENPNICSKLRIMTNYNLWD